MKNDSEEKLLLLLRDEWKLLKASVSTLQQSVEKCQKIGLKDDYTFEEQESFDSLTSKFNRSSDLFTQKNIRTVWMMLHEGFVPFIDLMNTCEKLGIIRNADQMINIRDLRNQIAHEYIPEALYELFPETLEHSQKLIDNIKCCEMFLNNRNWMVND